MESHPLEREACRREGDANSEPALPDDATAQAERTSPDTMAVVAAARRRRVLYLIFALSGLAGLVYEATWTRYLQLFLGHAAYAQVLVLSLFMGGMAVGALIAPRLGRATTTPLAAYAAIEALLGVAALAFHPVFDGVTTYAYETLLPGSQGSATATLVQWLIASMLILPQSILLGMTFPMMSAAVLRLGSDRGGRVFAMLYFVNSAGAVIGVLIAGFLLIEFYGLRATMIAAGLANLAVAAIAAAIARRVTFAPAVVRGAATQSVGRWLLVFAFSTGASSFLYEIGWLRMLALVQGSSTHAFETMLSAFILGIALGGLWIRKRIERYASPMLALACVQILMGLAALATLPAYNYAFDAMAGAMAVLPRNTLGYLGFNVAGYLISATIMVPAAFFAGMTLPLLTFLLYSRGRGEADIGAVYGWNTFGGILGTALGGLVLLPLIGLKDLLVAGAAIDIALGLALGAVLLRRGQLTAPRRAALTALAAAAVIGVFSALTLFDFDPTRMASGVFRHGRAQIREGSEVTFHADGRTASVDVIVDVLGGTSIATNGKVDASINMNRARGDRDAPAAPDEYTMTAAAALPLAYAPEARRAAIIGHGSGLTTHVLLASPLVEQVDVIEIEPEMIRGAREFLPRVQRAYNDPRARYFVEDARAFFARAAKRYDVIISEPSNPWVSGVASLFTPEYYRQAKRALSPNGLFVQWFQIYETDQALVASIVRAIGTVFPDYVLYSATSTNVVLVATPAGPLPTPSDALFAWPEMRAELDYLGIRTPRDLTLFRIGSRRTYAPLLETGRMNSDYFPFLEFGAARARFLDTHFAALLQNVRYPVPTIEILSGFDPPELPGPSVRLASINLRLLDVHRTAVFAGVLESGNPPSGADAVMLLDSDRQNLQTVLDVPADGTTTAWRTWYSALFALSEPMIPNGGFRSFERFVRSERVSVALRGAPQDVRDKIEFLLLVGARDLEGIRREGAQLLAGELHKTDPVFHAHVFVATMSACLAETPNASCRDLLRQLDRVRRGTPIVDLLRAHKAALP